MARGRIPRRLTPVALALAVCGLASAYTPPPPPHSEIPVTSLLGIGFSLFLDPDEHVLTKEFAFYYNAVPDTLLGQGHMRSLFHLMYQRTGGPQSAETMFGHAWTADLLHWVVDTSAFTVDTTWWNVAHVWAPTFVERDTTLYMFYCGVDVHGDQRIGYATTSLLDTTNTVWSDTRTMVWEAGDTRWAVPDPPVYGRQTQFRDPYVIPDPDSAGRFLMFYAAHDSADAKLNRSGLAVGVARSRPGTMDEWQDLGYYPNTLRSVTKIGQLEGPHVFSVDGTGAGWRLMFSSGGTPPGENGNTTIRFENLAADARLADTTAANWGQPVALMTYLGGNQAVFGWSGSEELHVNGGDFMAGFTAWGPFFQGVGITRVHWNQQQFTLGDPVVTSVDEVHSPVRDVHLSLDRHVAGTRHVTFLIDSPQDLAAKLEVFDAQGRRLASLLPGQLAKGRTSVTWDAAARGAPVASGVYFARLSFPGGVRAVQIPLLR